MTGTFNTDNKMFRNNLFIQTVFICIHVKEKHTFAYEKSSFF